MKPPQVPSVLIQTALTFRYTLHYAIPPGAGGLIAYIFMAVHYPEPGRHDDLHQRMTRMGASLAGAPGLIEIGAWLEFGGERVVGVSRWQSREAFEPAMPGSGAPANLIRQWQPRPAPTSH